MSTSRRRRKPVDYSETTDLTGPTTMPKKRARKGKAKEPVEKKEPELVVLSSSDEEGGSSTPSAGAKTTAPVEMDNLDELAVVMFKPFGVAWVMEKVERKDADDQAVTFYKLELGWGQAFVRRECITNLARDTIFNYSTGKGAITISKADKARLSPGM
jgi:hypothetical protein